MIKLLVFVLTMLATSPSGGQTPCVTQDYTKLKQEPDWDCPAPGEDSLVPKLQFKTSVPLKEADKAPFTGILMDDQRVIQLGLRITAIRRLLWLQMQTGQELLEVEKRYIQDSAQASLDLANTQRDHYKDQVVQLQKDLVAERAWYRSWSFGLVVGIVVTAAAGTALGVALH